MPCGYERDAFTDAGKASNPCPPIRASLRTQVGWIGPESNLPTYRVAKWQFPITEVLKAGRNFEFRECSQRKQWVSGLQERIVSGSPGYNSSEFTGPRST